MSLKIYNFENRYIEDYNISICGVSTLSNPSDGTLIFSKYYREDVEDVILKYKKSTIIIPKLYSNSLKNKNIIFHENPKFLFSKILLGYLKKLNIDIYEFDFLLPSDVINIPNSNIHNSALISKKCIIGKNVTIHPGAKVYGNVQIEDNVTIGANTVVGHQGFGFSSFDGEIIRVPHIGGVIIGEGVEVGCLTTIVSGTIEATIIGKNTKIDDHVHIGHNVIIGENCIITACAEICRSKIGNNVWIGPNSSIINGIKIGNNSIIGIGSNVIRNVEEGQTVVGNPAKIIKKVQNNEC